MDNVFDLVNDFYTQDPEWNTVLQQSYVENFLRAKFWQGASDDQLTQCWDHITILCVYLGNAESYLGDMSREDFIDCVGWCGRNVSDFSTTAANVAAFLDTIIDLYRHLAKKHIITSAKAPEEAKAKLLVDGKLQLMDSEGNFLPKYERYNLYATPDLPAKIFLNIGEAMKKLLDSMQNFFNDRKYHRDIERAAFLYSGILLSGVETAKPGTEEYAQCFWDYFLFDYHMLGDDKTPLRHFYDKLSQSAEEKPSNVSRDVLRELMQARLALFMVEGRNEEGTYNCRDFLTGEIYTMVLPIEDEMDTTDIVFLGHIFYNQSMVMNFVRGMIIPKSSRKRLHEIMENARKWMAIRRGGKLDWEGFLGRYAMFVRHVVMIYAAYVRMGGFGYQTQVKNYFPAEILDDDVTELIGRMMRPYAFSANDIHLAQTMWADYQSLAGKHVRVPEVWAAGIIRNFIDVNGVYNYDVPRISEMCHNVPAKSLCRTSNEVSSILALEDHDPRYINEEGLLLMLLS